MSLTYEIKHRNMIVRLDAEIDHHKAEEIRDRLDQLIAMNSIKVLIFDFSNTVFMDSSGIGVIMGRYKKMKQMGGDVGLINVNSNIQRVLKLSGIYRLVKNYESVQDAIKRLV
ncbi:MAG: anti-sigma F factor antagonist [Firmicutes bacterium HGW-Firmicutes-7]|nr:MAG: anti-sigma F factor antagonist [Firmicutes bacterium HGW-Firmicutes-7]